MWEGELKAIYVTAEAKGSMRAVPEAEALVGKGLLGDRYADGVGTWSSSTGPGRQVTLFEAETLEALGRDHRLPIDPALTRRNLLTVGVPLNHLVGREFTVGEVRLRGVRLCEPCTHLDAVAGTKLSKPLLHRGGLNAEVVAGGTLRPGLPVRPLAASS